MYVDKYKFHSGLGVYLCVCNAQAASYVIGQSLELQKMKKSFVR